MNSNPNDIKAPREKRGPGRYLAAAARACSDAETAERLERAVDAKYLRREGGLLWLDVNREWRIGATAMRIISLAESRGSRFRDMKKVD
jgi:hypothetical protein